MVSFSASKTLAALLLCFPLVALESRTCTIIWGQRLTEARSPGQQPQTRRKKVALAGRPSESQMASFSRHES